MGRAYSTHGKKLNAYRILMGKSEGKRPLGRPRRKRENTIKMDLREIGWSGMDRINLAQNMDLRQALANAVTNFQVS
jgi:hypothetical protein